MYNEYFGLTDRPFSIAPDPRYLYMSRQHKEALAHLMYGVQQDGGIILLTGEVGTGKTTICRRFLRQLDDRIDVAYIVNPKQTSQEILESICDDLDIASVQDEISIKSLTDAITNRLLQNHSEGKNTVVVIDEAQNLEVEVLEQLRLLTNLETDKRKLLQIVLLGQPELLDLLAREELRQLNQRVTARFHMDKLDRKDIIPYVRHRLAVAGCKMPLFPESTASVIEKASGGVPRLINQICDRSLLGVYSTNGDQVSVKNLKQAAKEVLGENRKANPSKHKIEPKWLVAFAGFQVCFLALWFLVQTPDHDASAVNQELVEIGQEAQLVDAQQVSPKLSEASSSNASAVQTTAEDIAPTLLSSSTQEGSSSSLIAPDLSLDRMFNAQAYTSLGQLWGIESLPNDWDLLCLQLQSTRLSCQSVNVSWQQLMHQNRPAVLTLLVKGQTKRLVINRVLNESNEIEVISTSGELTRVNYASVTALWTGKAEYFWLRPVIGDLILKEGNSHPYVAWVREQLLPFSIQESSAGEGENLNVLNETYDSDLNKAVIAFQKKWQLIDDGVIGPETMMLLNALYNPVPLLQEQQRLLPNNS
jgi:general secretion pathway protein A